LALPAYVAVNVFAPAVANVSWHEPVATVAVQVVPAPSLTVTFPTGVPPPGLVAVTEYATVTTAPTTEGSGRSLVIALVVAAGFTWCVSVSELPP